MICFRDMTFCSSNCTNTDCHRHFGPEEQEAARVWWGEDKDWDAPVAFSDFSANCAAYQAPLAAIETIK